MDKKNNRPKVKKHKRSSHQEKLHFMSANPTSRDSYLEKHYQSLHLRSAYIHPSAERMHRYAYPVYQSYMHSSVTNYQAWREYQKFLACSNRSNMHFRAHLQPHYPWSGDYDDGIINPNFYLENFGSKDLTCNHTEDGLDAELKFNNLYNCTSTMPETGDSLKEPRLLQHNRNQADEAIEQDVFLGYHNFDGSFFHGLLGSNIQSSSNRCRGIDDSETALCPHENEEAKNESGMDFKHLTAIQSQFVEKNDVEITKQQYSKDETSQALHCLQGLFPKTKQEDPIHIFNLENALENSIINDNLLNTVQNPVLPMSKGAPNQKETFPKHNQEKNTLSEDLSELFSAENVYEGDVFDILAKSDKDRNVSSPSQSSNSNRKEEGPKNFGVETTAVELEKCPERNAEENVLQTRNPQIALGTESRKETANPLCGDFSIYSNYMEDPNLISHPVTDINQTNSTSYTNANYSEEFANLLIKEELDYFKHLSDCFNEDSSNNFNEQRVLSTSKEADDKINIVNEKSTTENTPKIISEETSGPSLMMEDSPECDFPFSSLLDSYETGNGTNVSLGSVTNYILEEPRLFSLLDEIFEPDPNLGSPSVQGDNMQILEEHDKIEDCTPAKENVSLQKHLTDLNHPLALKEKATQTIEEKQSLSRVQQTDAWSQYDRINVLPSIGIIPLQMQLRKRKKSMYARKISNKIARCSKTLKKEPKMTDKKPGTNNYADEVNNSKEKITKNQEVRKIEQNETSNSVRKYSLRQRKKMPDENSIRAGITDIIFKPTVETVTNPDDLNETDLKPINLAATRNISKTVSSIKKFNTNNVSIKSDMKPIVLLETRNIFKEVNFKEELGVNNDPLETDETQISFPSTRNSFKAMNSREKFTRNKKSHERERNKNADTKNLELIMLFRNNTIDAEVNTRKMARNSSPIVGKTSLNDHNKSIQEAKTENDDTAACKNRKIELKDKSKARLKNGNKRQPITARQQKGQLGVKTRSFYKRGAKV